MRYIVSKLSDEFYWLICARAMVYAPFHGSLVNSGLQEKIPYLVIQDVTFRSLGYFLFCLNRSELAGPSIHQLIFALPITHVLTPLRRSTHCRAEFNL